MTKPRTPPSSSGPPKTAGTGMPGRPGLAAEAPRASAPAAASAPSGAPRSSSSAETAANRLGGSRGGAGSAARPAGETRRPAEARPTAPRPAAPRPAIRRRLRSWRPKLRLLPLLIFVAVLMLGMRAGDVFLAFSRGGSIDFVAPSLAQDPQPAQQQPAQAAASSQPTASPLPSLDGTRIAAPGGTEPAGGLAGVKEELLTRLSERREELDRRAGELEQREALLTAAEQRIDQKVAELTQLRGSIEKLLGEVDERQAEQLDSLVRIYENMKPKDAARIFEELDMPVLLSVLERMKEQKTAPILAAMDPMKAKEVTARLVEKRSLPAGEQQAARQAAQQAELP